MASRQLINSFCKEVKFLQLLKPTSVSVVPTAGYRRNRYVRVNKYDSKMPQRNPFGPAPGSIKRTEPILDAKLPDNFRFVYQDFLPDPDPSHRNYMKEKLERNSMLERRAVCPIPEFYVGCIMAVTVAEELAAEKTNRFLGICIDRGEYGLKSWFTLRNVVDGLGMEIKYDMYNPLILEIDVIKLEKRLDDQLYYLRDALPEYSTFPQDMYAIHLPLEEEIPVNTTKVELKPRPWHQRWERLNLRGVKDFYVKPRLLRRARWRQMIDGEIYDTMDQYRNTSNEEEQEEIFHEMHPHYNKLETSRRPVKTFSSSSKKFKA